VTAGLPHARLVHHIHGRARLRVPTRRGDARWFAEIERALGECALVRAAHGNPLTGSLLLAHEGELEEIERFALSHGLFAIVHPDPESDPVLRGLQERLGLLDTQLKEASAGAWGLSSAAFYALLAATAYQFARGEVFPAGGALLMQAIGVVMRAGETRPLRPPTVGAL
jgi:hypothetical protein